MNKDDIHQVYIIFVMVENKTIQFITIFDLKCDRMTME